MLRDFVRFNRRLFRNWLVVTLFIVDLVGLATQYGPHLLGYGKLIDIPPVVFMLIPVVGLYLASYSFYRELNKIRSSEPSQRCADQAAYGRLMELVSPDAAIPFLRNGDLGGAYQSNLFDGLYRYVREEPRPDRAFVDEDLERLRQSFLIAAGQFLDLLSRETFANDLGTGFHEVPREMRQIDPDRWKRTRDALNAAADSAVTAYDLLITSARRTLDVA